MTTPFLFVPTFSWPAAPGGLLYTYAATTTTPKATYSDAAGAVPNANPVVLDSLGSATVRLGSGSYKFVLKDSTGTTTLWTQDNYSSSFLTASDIGQLLYPQTAAETAAGVTVVNGMYPYGYVDRYGSNTIPGTTSMVAAFNAAVAQCQKGGAQVTYGVGPYLLDSPINCTFTGSANQNGIVIRNLGGISQDAGQGIVAKHNGVAVFDCTGSDAFQMYDVTIRTDAVTFPKTGVLWARNAAGGSQYNRMVNCRIVGSFSVSCLYNYGSEDDVLIGNLFSNSCTAAGTKTRVYTANNIASLTSPFTTIFSGSVSTIDHNAFGNQDVNFAGTATSDCIYVEACDGLHNFGGWAASTSGSSGGRSLVYFDQTNGPSSSGQIVGLLGEFGANLQSYGIAFSNHAQTPTGYAIENCRLSNSVNAINAPALCTLDNFKIRGISENASHGISIAGTIQNSMIDIGPMLLAIGTSTRNTLIGYTENWTITTRNNDFWIDQGSSNKTWTPNTSALTVVGALTVSNVKCLYHGSLVTLTCTLNAATSINCAAGTNLSGLPAPASVRSADVCVVNSDTPALIGQGAVVGTNIKLPAISVTTADVTITATYFVA